MQELIRKDSLLEEMRGMIYNGQNANELYEDFETLIDEQKTVSEIDIRNSGMEEFAHELKEAFNQEFPRNYESNKPYFTLEGVRKLVDVTVKQLMEVPR